MASRVCSMNAATSEATKFSPSPTPTTRGELRRAATTTSESSASTATNVKAPCSCRPTVRIAASSRSPAATRPASRWATTSVSVCEVITIPASCSSWRSAAKFSMIPLWMTAIRPS
jgi:hypothetical protein